MNTAIGELLSVGLLGSLRGGPFALDETYEITSPIGYDTDAEGEVKRSGNSYIPVPVGQPGNELWRDFNKNGMTTPHKGCDYGCPCGTRLLDPWDATVTEAAWSDGSGWRLRFEYQLDGDAFGGRPRVKVSHLWLHLAEAPRDGARLLRPSDHIFQGAHVATSGNTGSYVVGTNPVCPGGHLHERVDVNGHLYDPSAIYATTVEYSAALAAFSELQEEVNLHYFGTGGRTIRAVRTETGTEHLLVRPA